MRPIKVSKILEKKFKIFDFKGLWQQAMGTPERGGIWIVYGKEKNGKTFFALKLAEYISTLTKVLYISAEEGIGYAFKESIRRANIDYAVKTLDFLEYISIADLEVMLNKKHSPSVVFIDNTLVYGSAFKSADLIRLKYQYPGKLFVILAHEEKAEPVGATAKLAKKLASVICRIEGLLAHIGGRVPGGTMTIDEEKAMLYWGVPDELKSSS